MPSPRSPDGVFHLELASAGDVEVALRGVAEVLGLPPSAVEPPLDQLIDDARRRRLLLVLDTADRVAGLGAALGAVAAASSTIAFLVTSRSPLRIAAEHEYPLGPLASHGPGGGGSGTGRRSVPRACPRRPPGSRRRRRATWRRSPPSATGSTAFRSRSSSPRPASESCLLPPSSRASSTCCRSSPAERPTRRRASARCGTRSPWSYGLLDAGEQAVLQRLAVFARRSTSPAPRRSLGPTRTCSVPSSTSSTGAS